MKVLECVLAAALCACLATHAAACTVTGIWTDFRNDKALYNEYEITTRGTGKPGALQVMAVTPTAWASGVGTQTGSTVTFELDWRYGAITGSVNANCTAINWGDATEWRRVTPVHTVHAVFMNHLDVGYNGISPVTGFINNVLNVYFHEHFPRALTLQSSLRALGYTERFIYTTHPWLVSMYLDCPDLELSGIKLLCPSTEDVGLFKEAIARGDIAWHAGPFNLQPENMGPSLFEYGLSIAEDLDAQFNLSKAIRVLSQRDVPGMTRSVIPLLKKHNVQAVTVGENEGAPFVNVPKAFTWRDAASDESIIGMWHPHGYGGITRRDCVISPNGHALAYAFRTDNSGPPQSLEELLGVFATLRAEFPGATVMASTYEAFVEQLLKDKDTLQVVTGEIGDVWIQGVSSDPVKMTHFREASRARRDCYSSGQCDPADPRIKAFNRFLVKIPEHTWGLPSAKDNAHWSNAAFEAHRGDSNFVNCSMAWSEQREFVQLAVAALGDHPLAKDIEARLRHIAPSKPSLDGLSPVKQLNEILTCGDWKFGFDGDVGALTTFSHGSTSWASADNMLGQFSYITLNETDFDYMAAYYGGFNAGYSKPNSTCAEPGCPNPVDATWHPAMTDLWYSGDADSCRAVLRLTLEGQPHTKYGAPSEVYVEYAFTTSGVSVDLQIFNKTTTRLPEQIMFEFTPVPSQGLDWLMDKLGSWVSPYEVVLNGSQYQHAVWSGVQYAAADNSTGMMLSFIDTPLAAPITNQARRPGWLGTPTAMPVPTSPLPADSVVGFAANLYNNVWNTNYILFYPYLQGVGDENARFRFGIRVW